MMSKKCLQSPNIQQICISSTCQQNVLVGQGEVNGYSKLHNLCPKIDISTLNKLAQLKTNAVRQFTEQLQAIDRTIDSLLVNSKQLLKNKLVLGNLSPKYQTIMKILQSKQHTASLKGKDIKQLYQQLQAVDKVNYNNKQQLLKQYERQSLILVNQIITIKHNIVGDYLKKIDSNILKMDQNYDKKMEIITKQIGDYRRLKLLFRASQHQFKAQQFHRHCDSIKGTVVLIQTQYGTIFGGFTSIRWNQVKNSICYDQIQPGSFMFSFDMMKTMTFELYQYGIYCNSNCGPTFGPKFDIYISNRCHDNANSYASIPECYYDDQQFQSRQQSYKSLIGSKNGNNFKVKEYEVFEVVYN